MKRFLFCIFHYLKMLFQNEFTCTICIFAFKTPQTEVSKPYKKRNRCIQISRLLAPWSAQIMKI